LFANTREKNRENNETIYFSELVWLLSNGYVSRCDNWHTHPVMLHTTWLGFHQSRSTILVGHTMTKISWHIVTTYKCFHLLIKKIINIYHVYFIYVLRYNF